MPLALEVVSGRVTNPGATLTALTPNTGSTFTVRTGAPGAPIYLVTMWTQSPAAGEVRLRSPRLHDQADGIRLRSYADVPAPLIPPHRGQQLQPQDAFTFELSGPGAGQTGIGALLVYYLDLPGSAARLATWEDIQGRITNLAGVRENVTASSTAGDVAQPQPLTGDQDTFKRGRDYALLGVTADVDCALLGLVGPDTGNYIVGLPVDTSYLWSPMGFVELARATGLACIPIINGANVGATNVAVAHYTASQAVNADFLFAELG